MREAARRNSWPIGLAAGGLALSVLASFVLPFYYLHMFTVALIFALFAVGFNLLMGHGGLLSFGHAAFFGLGGYAYALLIVRAGWAPVPAALAAPVVVALFGLAIGAFCVRLHGILFGMLTLAFGQILWAIVHGWYTFTGGDDGIVGLPRLPGVGTLRGHAVLVAVVVIPSLLYLHVLHRSPFVQMLRAARQNRQRVAALGVDVTRLRLAAFVVSTAFSGVAGVLFAMVDRSVFPIFMYWTTNAQVLMMSLLGGMFTFTGPILGAFGITALRYVVAGITIFWPFVFGLIIVLTIFVLPEGVVGSLRGRLPWTRGRAAPAGGQPARALDETAVVAARQGAAGDDRATRDRAGREATE